MSELLPLTELPEWSDFFRALGNNRCLHLKWRKHETGWSAQVYEFTMDPSKPLAEELIGEEKTGPDKFEVIRLALKDCGREIRQPVWDAFYAFREAVDGGETDIEDLI